MKKLILGKMFFMSIMTKKQIITDTLENLSREYCDQTTTPIGVAPRYHTRINEIWTWGTNGNNPCMIEKFDNEDEAYHALLLSFKYDLDKNPEAPYYYFKKEEAISDLEEFLENQEEY